MRCIVSVFVCLVIASCGSDRDEVVINKDSDVKSVKTEDKGSDWQKASLLFFSDKQQIAKKMYNAAYRYDVEKLRILLRNGGDPNFCNGEGGWTDSTPLAATVYGFYNTYHRVKRGEILFGPRPDVLVVQALKEAGARINERPYIWQRVYLYSNSSLEMTIQQAKLTGIKPGSDLMNERIAYYVRDANHLIEAFIEAGADVDKTGHPYPYDFAKNRGRITDEKANEYFIDGTRPINEAIKKGIVWEEQVDLLLKYTTLDENSLKAAKESEDPKMIAKIDELWTKRNR